MMVDSRSPRPFSEIGHKDWKDKGFRGRWEPSAQISADRYYAFHLCGDLKDVRAVPLLVPLLNDSEVDHTVPWALGGIGEKTVVSPLMQILSDKESRHVDFRKQEKTSASEQFKMRFVPSREEKGRLLKRYWTGPGRQIETSVVLADSKESTPFSCPTDPFHLPESSSLCKDREQRLLEEDIVNTTIAVTKQVTTLINVLTVEPKNQEKVIELLRGNTENVVSRLDGWISTSFIAAKDQHHVVIYSQWRDLASVEAMRANPDMVAYFPRIAALAKFDGFAGDVVYNHHASCPDKAE